MARTVILAAIGAVVGGSLLAYAGYIIHDARAQPKQPQGESVSDKPSQSTTGKNSPIINAPTTNPHFGDVYIFQAPPKQQRLTFNDAVKAELLAKIPKDKPVTVRAIGPSATTAEQITKFLGESGYTASMYRSLNLIPAPRAQLIWDGSLLTVAPIE